MSELAPGTHKSDLRHAAAVIALAIVMVGAAALLYFLSDILLILFLGIVVAAALQPGHVWLSHWGVPKGLTVDEGLSRGVTEKVSKFCGVPKQLIRSRIVPVANSLEQERSWLL